jgi:hypothetical protein
MGMYTEIFVNIDLKQDIPEDVLYVLKGMVRSVKERSNYHHLPFNHSDVDTDDDKFVELTSKFSNRFPWLFCNGSYYTPNTTVAELSYDFISESWSLLGKGDIKNYGGEIQQFFEWIAPYSDTEFLGYSRYEECDEPTLYYRKDFLGE